MSYNNNYNDNHGYNYSNNLYGGGNGNGNMNNRRPSPSQDHHDPYYNDNSDIYSQYSQPSFVSNNGGQNGNGNGYNGNRGAPSTSYAPAAAAAAAPPGPGDYFNQAPTQIQPRPSFSSSHHPYTPHQDFDETETEPKSYSSTTNLTNKEWGVGQVIPPVPPLTGYPPPRTANPYAVSPMAYQPPQTPGGTAHWHQVRNQLMERRVVKQIPLINGNLVMDVPVPKGCITGGGGVGSMPDEMEKMRYSAATCDPDEFMRKRFSLRPVSLSLSFVLDPVLSPD
jgi:chitin synthase